MNKLEQTFNILISIVDKIDSTQDGTIWWHGKDGEMYQLGDEISDELKGMINDTKKYYKKTLGFVQVHQQQEAEVSRDLTGAALKILGLLRSHLKFGNKVYGLTHKYIGDYLHMSQRSVSRAMKELIDYQMVIVMGRKHNKVYKLNPANTTKGKFNESKETLRQFRKKK